MKKNQKELINLNTIEQNKVIVNPSCQNFLYEKMFGSLNMFDSEPPSLQVISKHKHIKNSQRHPDQSFDKNTNPSLTASQKQSPFASKPQQSNQPMQQINQATIQSNDKSQENELKKIKKYSKILQTTNHLNKMYHTSSPSVHQPQNLSIQLPSSDFISKGSLTFEIQNVYNHYALKNERKSRVLAKAKELGKNNFYKFLKESSIIGTNQHIHRFFSHPKNLDNLNSSPIKSRELSPQSKTLMVVSLEPNKAQISIQQKNKKKLGLPKLLQRQTIKQKITLKTEMPLDPDLCLTTEGSSLSLKKSSSNKKQLIRNLTQINEKLRKNRKVYHEKETLLFPTQNLSMRNPQNFLSKWKYKSLFDTGENNSAIRKTTNEKKSFATRMKTFTGHEKHENNRLESNFSAIFKGNQKMQQGFQSKLKFLKISRSKLLKKEISDMGLSRNLSFLTKNETQQQK